MDCFHCGTPYNETENCPRLLINCGHSLCQRCLTENFRQGLIVCPECHTLNKSLSLSDFPKNLALLHVKPTPLVERQVNRTLQTTVATEPQIDMSNLCQKHKKKIEAFCENDRQLLCITCILEEGYKNQDICSIQDAAHKERNLIQKAFELSQIIEGKLKDLQKEIVQTHGGLNDSAEKARVEITQFFNEIKKVISERETSLKQKISEHLRKQEHLLKKKDENITKHLKNITGFYDEYQKSLAEKEIPLLNASPKRIEVIKKATMDIEKVSGVTTFSDLNKENELNLLWKTIQSLRTTTKEVPLTGNTTQPAKPSKATANTLSNAAKSKGTKDFTKQTTAGVRNSMNLKKEPVPVTSAAGGHPFVFSIVDKNGNKIPAPKDVKQKEDLGIENRRQSDKRQTSPARASSAKSKNPQSYYALRNSQKDREALQEKVPVGDQIVFTDPQVPHAKMTSTPKRETKGHDEQDSIESAGSDTPPQKIEAMTYDPSPIIAQNRQAAAMGNLQYNPQWAFESMNVNKPEEKDSAGKAMRSEPSKGMQFQENFVGVINNIDDGRPQFPKLYDMNSSIDPQSLSGSIIEMSIQKEFKMLASEIGTSTLDMVDLANHKLDFSVLCQHATSFIYVMGGFIEDSQHFIEKYDLQKGKWEIAGTFVNNRTKFSSLALPDKGAILILGGKQEGARTALCEEYSLTDQVVKSSDICLTSPKSGFGAILIKDDIILCGGNDGHSILKTFEAYNLKSRRWTNLPPLELRRDELALTIGPDQKIYAIGGFGGPNNTCLSEVERYDFQKGRWESIAPLNTPRRALSAVTLPDGIYAIGGFDGENYLSTVERYEESTNEWVFVASMNYPRCTLSAVASSDNRNIYVLGGFDNGPLKTVERYSVIDDTWEIMPPMYFKRFMHAAVMVNK